MFIVVCRLFAFDLSPHGVGMALGSVANIGKINCCGVGYFLQKIGYFLHFCPFSGVLGEIVENSRNVRKMATYFVFYEMRCSEKLRRI